MRSFLLSSLIFLTFLSLPVEGLAQRHGWGWYEGMPYGQYCPHRRWGGPYGVRRSVDTAEAAKKVLEDYFATRHMTVSIGRIEERRWFFLAEILDRDGTMVDRTIVDKRTGRIRSIY